MINTLNDLYEYQESLKNFNYMCKKIKDNNNLLKLNIIKYKK